MEARDATIDALQSAARASRDGGAAALAALREQAASLQAQLEAKGAALEDAERRFSELEAVMGRIAARTAGGAANGFGSRPGSGAPRFVRSAGVARPLGSAGSVAHDALLVRP